MNPDEFKEILRDMTIFAFGYKVCGMEIFYSQYPGDRTMILDEEESRHCIKVLRHKCGDEINVIDGKGSLFRCRLTSDSPKRAEAEILCSEHGWGGHRYNLEMAVCPTKNMDRYEWFTEKACEIGLDSIVPVIGEHSERKVLKPERLTRILIAATKQSLKSRIPELSGPISVKDYILSSKDRSRQLKLMAWCFEDESHPRISIKDALDSSDGHDGISILIGPEGDFSQEEAALALSHGFIPVHLGPSRLRTETAALAAVMSVYSHFQL